MLISPCASGVGLFLGSLGSARVYFIAEKLQTSSRGTGLVFPRVRHANGGACGSLPLPSGSLPPVSVPPDLAACEAIFRVSLRNHHFLFHHLLEVR